MLFSLKVEVSTAELSAQDASGVEEDSPLSFVSHQTLQANSDRGTLGLNFCTF